MLGNVIFLRHGQARNNVEQILAGRTHGFALTDDGVSQAQYAAQMLAEMNVSAIYSSPIQRAEETANIVGKELSVNVSVDERLIELDMGKFTGMGYDEIYQSHGNVFLKFYNEELEIAHNGVETFAQVKKRVTEMAEHVTTQHSGENVVLVTHMDPIKAMLSVMWNLSPEVLFELIIANGSLNIFREYQGHLSVSAFNVMHASRFESPW